MTFKKNSKTVHKNTVALSIQILVKQILVALSIQILVKQILVKPK